MMTIRLLALYPSKDINDDLIASIECSIKHPQEVLNKIKVGQTYIATKQTPMLIGEKWHQTLTQLFN